MFTAVEGSMSQKLLFVCLGNICRSPAAEGITNHLLQSSGHEGDILCDSAGTAAYHLGSPPDRRMRQVAQRYGLELHGQARQIHPLDLREFDLILAMDRQNYRDILSLDPQRRYADKVRLICSYCRSHTDEEVPDPYYGGEAGFHYVIELLWDACSGLLESLIPGIQCPPLPSRT
ncbi:protein-tyrosine phosphatase [Thermostichus sp. MS-CIW-19]|jgi:protein-tyrosine phosphatase